MMMRSVRIKPRAILVENGVAVCRELLCWDVGGRLPSVAIANAFVRETQKIK